MPKLIDGLGKTVLVSIISIIIGFVLGLLVCFMVRSRFRVLRAVAKAYVWCVRGTPMMIQALIIFFVVSAGSIQLLHGRKRKTAKAAKEES